jgi:predicted nicotinamide N-methyase
VRELDVELVDDAVALDGLELAILHPRQADELLDEDAFAREEYLPYWAELWPSGVALARALRGRALRGARVLELGCGLALPSIVAARAGARVLATDWSADAVEFAARNAARNGVELETAICSWAEPAIVVERAPWKLVLAADVLYERRNVDLLLGLLPRLVDQRGEVLLADPGRPHAALFLEVAGEAWSIHTRADRAHPRVSVHRLRKRFRDRHADVSACLSL